ncbi:MAG TPA: serine hydrolase domain-containing protein [Reyranella sp.]|nr:serine hydrolase domain-containing protein [Reyranella sp.]
MKTAGRSFVAVLALALAAPAWAQSHDTGIDSARTELIGKAFQGWVDDGRLPGAVLLIEQHGKVAYSKAIGFRDREQKTAMTADSIFRIMSMTKPVVSVAAMMLAEEGKLDIAAPVAQYLPEFKDLKVRVETVDPATGRTREMLVEPHRPMIVQDLFRHTAGLVYGPPIGQGPVPLAYRSVNMGDRNGTLADMITKMSKLPLVHQPGEVWEYSMAIDVLGRVVEVASGMALDRYLDERIFKPLGMGSTGFYVPEDKKSLIAQPQIDKATGKRPPMFDPAEKPRWFSGGGGLVSTAADYLKFAEMLLHRGRNGSARILSPATVQLMTANALTPGIAVVPSRGVDITPSPAMGQGFGLGFAVRTEAGQNPLPGSPGSFYWTGAHGTTFYVDPKQDLIIVMMIQSPSPENSFYRRAFRYLSYQALTQLD